MATRRTARLNSLLKEVISDVIRDEVKNPHIHPLLTVTRVNVTADLHYAKVYVSVIGEAPQQKDTIAALQSASGFIGTKASKKVTLRYFPQLTFILDDSVEHHMRIEQILHDINLQPKSSDGQT